MRRWCWLLVLALSPAFAGEALVSWTEPNPEGAVDKFDVTASKDGEFVERVETTDTQLQFVELANGEWAFVARAFGCQTPPCVQKNWSPDSNAAIKVITDGEPPPPDEPPPDEPPPDEPPPDEPPPSDFLLSENFESPPLSAPWYDETDIATQNGAYHHQYVDGVRTVGGGASRVAINDEGEMFMRADVTTTMQTGHLFYFKAAASEFEPPTDKSSLYLDVKDGKAFVDNRNTQGQWNNSKSGSVVIADGESHELWMRAKLNTPGQSDGVVEVYVDGDLDISIDNWQFVQRREAINQFLLGPYLEAPTVGTVDTLVDDLILADAMDYPTPPPDEPPPDEPPPDEPPAPFDISFVSTGGSMYYVEVDGQLISNHSTWHKAVEVATILEVTNPDRDTRIKQTLEIRVEK